MGDAHRYNFSVNSCSRLPFDKALTCHYASYDVETQHSADLVLGEIYNSLPYIDRVDES